MGTTLFDKFGIEVKRFYGGVQRGVCVQITIGREYRQMTYAEYCAMILILFLDTILRGLTGT